MNKKRSSVLIYIILVSAVLIAKVLGLIRGMVFSAAYGTTVEASAFTAVSNLPLTIFDITFGTAITSAFVPVFNEKLFVNVRKGADKKTKKDAIKAGKKEANKFASNFLNIVLLFSLILVVLIMIFPQYAVMLVARGFDSNSQAMAIATDLMRYIAPVITFACCTYIFIGVLQSYEEFIAPALVSLLSNLSMIVYLLFLNKEFKIDGLAIAFSVGWLLQFVFLIPFLKKKKFKYSLILDFRSDDIKKVAVLTLPLFVAAVAQPINQLISSNFSSRVSESGIATVSYAYNAYLIVAGVFSYALTNMFFPKMSRKFAQNDVDGATEICKNMLSSITAIIVPIMVFVGSCAEPIIKILYQRGEFTADDTKSVASLLVIYAIAMIALSWQDIFNKYFYSMQMPKVPMLSAAVGIVINVVLSVLLIFVFDFGLKGLASATVIAGFSMVLVLALCSLKYTRKIFTPDFAFELLKVFIGGAAAFAVCRILLAVLNFNVSLVLQVIFVLLILALALAVYILFLFILKSRNISEIKSVLKKGDDPKNV